MQQHLWTRTVMHKLVYNLFKQWFNSIRWDLNKMIRTSQAMLRENSENNVCSE